MCNGAAPRDMARLGTARHGSVRQGKGITQRPVDWQQSAGRCESIGSASTGRTWRGGARHCLARLGKTRQGHHAAACGLATVRRSMRKHPWHDRARRVSAGRGPARLGRALQRKARASRSGLRIGNSLQVDAKASKFRSAARGGAGLGMAGHGKARQGHHVSASASVLADATCINGAGRFPLQGQIRLARHRAPTSSIKARKERR